MGQPFNRVWRNSWQKCDGLSFEARSIYHYALTCHHRNAAGFFRLPVPYIVEDTGAREEVVRDALNELQGVDLVMYCDATAAILIVDNSRHDPPANVNQGIHRVDLWREGALPGGPPAMRRRCLVDLADRIGAMITDRRDVTKESVRRQLAKLASAVEEMRAEASMLEPRPASETVSNGIRTTSAIDSANNSDSTIIKGIDSAPPELRFAPRDRSIELPLSGPPMIDDSDEYPECRNAPVLEGFSSQCGDEIELLEFQLDDLRRAYPGLDVESTALTIIRRYQGAAIGDRPATSHILQCEIDASLAEIEGRADRAAEKRAEADRHAELWSRV